LFARVFGVGHNWIINAASGKIKELPIIGHFRIQSNLKAVCKEAVLWQ
jgi:hypothetical protein